MPLIARLAFTIVSIAIVALGGFGVTSAAADALPGDFLYPVKILGEQLQLQLADDESAETLQLEFDERRREEVKSLLKNRRAEDVRFFGEITDFDDSSWWINEIQVFIGDESEVKGVPSIGAVARVEAMTQEDGTLLGLRLSILTPIGSGPHGLPTGIPHDPGPGPNGNYGSEPGQPTGTPSPVGSGQGSSQDPTREQHQEGYQEPATSPMPVFTPTAHGLNSPGYQEPAVTQAPGGNPGQSGPNGSGPQASPSPEVNHKSNSGGSGG